MSEYIEAAQYWFKHISYVVLSPYWKSVKGWEINWFCHCPAIQNEKLINILMKNVLNSDNSKECEPNITFGLSLIGLTENWRTLAAPRTHTHNAHAITIYTTLNRIFEMNWSLPCSAYWILSAHLSAPHTFTAFLLVGLSHMDARLCGCACVW